MIVTAVVGNPKPRSRTRAAAELVASRLTGAPPAHTLDLVELGAGLLDRASPEVAAAQETVRASDLLVVATPTYKGSYTGLLKLFLDRFGADELAGRPAVPLMLGGDLRHSLAVEYALKPVLVEIGASCPTRGLFLVDSSYDDPAALDGWLPAAQRQLGTVLGQLR